MEFEQFVAERYRALCRFAMVLCGDAHLAEEMVSDTLGHAYERWQMVSAADNVHAYVRKMLLREYLGWRRRSARLSVRSDVPDLVDPRTNHAEAHADRQRLLAELRRLPPKQRAAVVLRYYEGLAIAEIADLLGSGENAVRSNLSRALKQLRVQLDDDEDDDAHRPAPDFALKGRQR